MVCGNCGAAYSESDLKCPYCGSENKKEAERRHILKLKEYDKEAEEIKKLPEKIVKKSTKTLMVFGVCAAGCAVIVLLLVLVFGKLSSSRQFKTLQSSLNQLEVYYQEESYLEMREYIARHELTGNSFNKYRETANLYFAYSQMSEQLDEFDKTEKAVSGERLLSSIETILYYGADTLSGSKSAIEDKGILGNEDVLRNIYGDAVNELKEKLGLTEDEIRELEDDTAGKTKRIEALAEVLLKKNQ